MTDASLRRGAALAAKARKDRVHTTMLVELLALLIFLAFAFAFAMQDERDRLDPWKARFEAARRELAELKAENRELSTEVLRLTERVRVLESSLMRLLPNATAVRANDRVLVDRKTLDDLINKAAVSEARLDENERLRARLAGRGGVDRPNCSVTPGFLIQVRLLAGGGYEVSPQWPATAEQSVARVPGAIALGRGGVMSAADFARRAAEVDAWARQQTPQCGFRAVVAESHSNLDLYKRQVSLVERHFYVRRR